MVTWREGVRYGLPEWRDNDWRWDLFGEMVPVKNRDLWQRIDRAMEIHQVECRTWRVDWPHASVPGPVWETRKCPTIRLAPDAEFNKPGSCNWPPAVGVGSRRQCADRNEGYCKPGLAWHHALGLGRLCGLKKITGPRMIRRATAWRIDRDDWGVRREAESKEV